MSVHAGLRELFDRQRATYAVLPPPAIPPPPNGARDSRVPPRAMARTMARTVVIHLGSGLSLAVLPEHSRVDLPRLSAALRDPVRLADAREVAAAFPDCDPDAVPPFGVLYGLKTYLDESLTHDRHIHFHAGSVSAVLRMPFEEYRRVAAPVVLWLSESLAGA